MRFVVFFSALLCLASSGRADEKTIQFSRMPLGPAPAQFRSVLTGDGQPGTWRIIRPEGVPAQADAGRGAAVLAQLSTDPTDEHFPLLVYEGEKFGDFTLSTRLLIRSGNVEQMGGIAFRLLNETNYYYIRLSALGHNIRFLKVFAGQRSEPIGPAWDVAPGVWHDLKIECEANHIRCWLDGKEAFPMLTDNSFVAGKIAFLTKSDSVVYFADTAIRYTPVVSLAESVLEEMLRKYPRLRGLQLYMESPGTSRTRVVASKNPRDVGRPGGKVESDVIQKDVIYFGKPDRGVVTVTLPLHNRNGDPVAAVRVQMNSFPGQTEENAIARALPIVRQMEARTQTSPEFFDF